MVGPPAPGEEPRNLPPLGAWGSAAVFGAGALLLVLAARLLQPALIRESSVEPIRTWFAAASLGVFAPLVVLGIALLRLEGRSLDPRVLVGRLRLTGLERGDGWWILAALAGVGLLSGVLLGALRALAPGAELHPEFMRLEPVGPGRYGILVSWLPVFLLNVFGEEFLWRGVVLPRQEVAFGSRAWLANGLGWWLTHAAFPWPVLIALLPVSLILPWLVQRRGRTWPGVILHAVFNGSGFLMVAFGLL